MSPIENIIQKAVSGNASKAEMHQLNGWLRLSEKNRKMYDEQLLLWQFMGKAKKSVDTDVDVNAAWERFALKKEEASKETPFSWYKIAAVVFVILTAGVIGSYLFVNNFNDKPVIQAKKNPQTVSPADSAVVQVADNNETPTSTIRKKRTKQQFEDEGFTVKILPDSSQVTLAPNSVLNFLNFTPEQRVVSLAGAGFFNLKPMNQDFVIETKELIIRVEGTKFNIKTESEEYKFIELYVEEGSMEAYEIGNPSNKVVLTSSESYIYDVEKHQFFQLNKVEKTDSKWKRFVNKISKPFKKKNKKEEENE